MDVLLLQFALLALAALVCSMTLASRVHSNTTLLQMFACPVPHRVLTVQALKCAPLAMGLLTCMFQLALAKLLALLATSFRSLHHPASVCSATPLV